MITHRFPDQLDTKKSSPQPLHTKQAGANGDDGPHRHDDWSAPQDVHGQRLLLTVSEAARQLGIGRSLLYELLAAGHVESIHVGRLRRIPTDALATYIDRQRTNRPDIVM